MTKEADDIADQADGIHDAVYALIHDIKTGTFSSLPPGRYVRNACADIESQLIELLSMCIVQRAGEQDDGV